MTNTNKQIVQTSDIILAATLVSTGHKLDNIRVDSIGTGTFVFVDVDPRFILTYEAGGTCIEPKTFNQTMVKLTRMCRAKHKRNK